MGKHIRNTFNVPPEGKGELGVSFCIKFLKKFAGLHVSDLEFISKVSKKKPQLKYVPAPNDPGLFNQ